MGASVALVTWLGTLFSHLNGKPDPRRVTYEHLHPIAIYLCDRRLRVLGRIGDIASEDLPTYGLQ